MKHYGKYKQDDFREIVDLIATQNTCLLQTISADNEVQAGLFNPLYLDEHVYFHLNRGDEQVASIRANGQCKLIFQDVLALFPSHWMDERYAGAATTYYRFAELECTTCFVDDDEDKPYLLKKMMEHYQPEGRYDPISPDSDIYRKKLNAILILDCQIVAYRGKWKLGQNRSVADRHRFIEKFRARNQGEDRRCADEIAKWLEAHPDDGSES